MQVRRRERQGRAHHLRPQGGRHVHRLCIINPGGGERERLTRLIGGNGDVDGQGGDGNRHVRPRQPHILRLGGVDADHHAARRRGAVEGQRRRHVLTARYRVGRQSQPGVQQLGRVHVEYGGLARAVETGRDASRGLGSDGSGRHREVGLRLSCRYGHGRGNARRRVGAAQVHDDIGGGGRAEGDASVRCVLPPVTPAGASDRAVTVGPGAMVSGADLVTLL